MIRRPLRTWPGERVLTLGDYPGIMFQENKSYPRGVQGDVSIITVIIMLSLMKNRKNEQTLLPSISSSSTNTTPLNPIQHKTRDHYIMR
jgi:hypothetical protein